MELTINGIVYKFKASIGFVRKVNKNLDNVTQRNKDYQELMKSKHGFDISDEVVNFKIKYCENFKPKKDYLDKDTRLSF